MAKYYFKNDNEMCYTLDYHLQYMAENDIKEMEVFEAEMDIKSGYFYCSELMEVGEVGEGCGKECHLYNPRNGKNGRCRFSKNCYSPGKSKILKLCKN